MFAICLFGLCVYFLLSFRWFPFLFVFAANDNRCYLIFIFYSPCKMGGEKKTNKLGNRVPEWGEQRSSTSWVWMWATSNITPYWWQKVILNFHFLIARHDDQANIRAAHFDSHWYAKQWIILCKVVTLAGNIFQHQNLGGGEYITLIVQKVRWGKLLGNNLW